MSRSKVTLLTHDARWRGQGAGLKRAAEAALRAEKSKGAVTLVLTDDKEIRALNKQYRGKDKPTNVLAFPDGATHGALMQLGDIILAYDTIAAEATTQKKKFSHHARHLVVHGVLHLMGHDHMKPKDADRMEQREIRILGGLSIANPYEAK